MRPDLTRNWEHLRSELRHWRGQASAAVEWIDTDDDYSRGRVSVPHPQRRKPEAPVARTGHRSNAR